MESFALNLALLVYVALFVLVLCGMFLWGGVITLRDAREKRPTSLDGILPLKGRWLRIVWGVFLLLLGLIPFLLGLILLLVILKGLLAMVFASL